MKSFYYFLVGISLLAFGFSGVATSIDARLGLVYKENLSPKKQDKPQPKKHKEAKGNAKITRLSLLTGEITTTDALALPPSITATKSVAVQGGGNAVPGSQLNYTIVINNGGTDATGVAFNDILVSDLTLVAGTVKATPIGVNDAYTSIGNVGITVPVGSGVLANDVSPDGTAITASVTTNVTNGTLTLAADGSFTYTPTTGYSGSDSFVYTVTSTNGLTSTNNTVTLTVTAPLWFVNIAAATSGTGTLANPFKDWSDFATSNALTGATNPAASQTIFVYSGTYTGAATLKTGQKVLGQGATTTLASFAGVTVPTFSNALPATSGTNPNLTSSGTTITLASGNSLRGFNMGNSTYDIAGTSFGILTASEMTLNGTGATVDLSTGTVAANFVSISSANAPAGATNGVLRLNSVTGTFTSGSTTITTPTTAFGINVLNSSTVTANFGNTAITGVPTLSILVTGGTSNTSSLTFGDLDITCPSLSQAINTNHFGSFTCTSGTIITSNSNGMILGGPSSANRETLNMVLTSFSAGGSSKGMTITNTSGSFAINGTGTTVGSGGTISTVTDRGVDINTATNITLKNMNFTNANTAAGTIPTQTSNSAANAALYFESVTGITLDNIQMNATVGNANAQNGINLFNCSNFSLANSTITRCGSGVDHACLYAINTTGTNVISNTTLSKASRPARFTNNSSNMTLKVTGSSFNDSRTLADNNTLNANGQAGILFEGYGTSQMSLDVKSSCNFLRAAQGINAYANETSRVEADVQSSTFNSTNASLATGEDVGNAADLASSGSGRINFNVLNNTITTRGGPIINVFTADNSLANAEGTIDGNTITYNFQPTINNNGGSGIRVDHNSTNTTTRIKINGNTLRNFGGALPIDVLVNGPTGGGRADIICTNNIIMIGTANFGPLNDQTPPNYGIRMSSAQTGQIVTICTKTAGNTIYNDLNTGVTKGGGVGGLAQMRAANGGNVHLFEGNNGGVTTGGGMVNIWNNTLNTPTATGSGGGGGTELSVGGSGTLTYGQTCVAPSNPPLNLSVPSPVLVENLPKETPIEGVNQTEAEDALVEGEGEISTDAIPSTESSNSSAKIAAPLSGETVTVNGSGSGFSLPAGKSTTVTFSATVSSTPSTCAITNQASVTYAGGSATSNTTTTNLVVPPINAGSTISATSVCSGGTVDLAAACPSGSQLKWFTASSGGSSVSTISPFSPTNITAATSYYASCTIGGCESTRTLVGSVTLIPNNTVTLTSAAGTNAQTKCINTPITNITYSTTGATGATFSGLPAGVTGAWASNVVTISGTPTTTTGSPFNYTVTLTGGCGTITATGTITVSPVNTVSLTSAVGTNAQTVCINSPITNITYATTGATGATFSGLPAGVTGAWAANVVTISGSPTTTTGSPFSYTVTLTGGCGTVTATGTITVSPANTVSLTSAVGTNAQTKCVNTAITNITYSTTGATGATFSGLPAGVTGAWASNVVTISGMPTTATGSPFSYTVTLTGGCGTVTATGTITVNSTAAPTAPTATPSSRTTVGSSTLSATGCAGGTLTWYNAADNVAVSSPNNQPNFTAQGTYNFYAKCTGANTCVSDASANVSVSVNLCTPLGASPGNVGINWTGLVSTDWNNACNWNPAWVPDATNSAVVIDLQTNQPTISGTVPTVNVIYVNSNATLTVSSGGTLNANSTAVPITLQGGNIINDGTINVSGGGTSVGLNIGATASITNRGTITTNNLYGIALAFGNLTFTNESTGIYNGDFKANNNILTLTNHGTINYGGGTYALSLGSSGSSVINDGTISVTGGSGISNPSGSTITNNACGKILMTTGAYENAGTTTNYGLIQMPNLFDFTNTGLFTNPGFLKANSVSGVSNSSVIITNSCPIFTFGRSRPTITGIFTDNIATTSAGTYTSVDNKFAANNTIPTGTQALYAQLTNGTCTFVVPFDFNNRKPTAVSVNKTAICTGTSVTLSGTCSSGTLTWYTTATGGSNIGTGTNLSNSPTIATTYYAACETTNCVSGRVATNEVTINSLPNASANSNSPICAGATLNLNSGSEGNTYLWTGPNSFTSTELSPSIANATVSATGTYVIRITNASNCSSTATVAVIVNAIPAATASSNSPVCIGNTISLTGGGVGTYAWSGPDGFSSTAQSPTIASATLLASGTYTITVTNANSCSSTATTSVMVNGLATASVTPSTQTICSGGTITTIAITGTGTSYTWTRDNTTSATGIAGSGTGDISGSLTNTTDAPITVTFTITPVGACNGIPITATVVVNPIPTVTASTPSQSICSGTSITGITFNNPVPLRPLLPDPSSDIVPTAPKETKGIVLNGPVVGTVFNWTRDNTATVIGIAASGSGNISGTLTNITASPVTVTFTVTPSFTNAGTTCTGTPITVTVTVNPNPASATITDAGTAFCSGSSTTLSAPANPNYTYAWERSLTGIANPNEFTAFGGTAQTQVITTSGVYRVIVTNQYNCSARDTTAVKFGNIVFSGSLAAGDAQQTGRMNRFGVVSTCAAPKSYPGDFTTSGARFYDSYTVTNPTSAPICATIGLTSGCGVNIFSAAYLGSFNPASVSTNYLADPGSSFPNTAFYEATIPANGTIVVVVHERDVNIGCSNYNLRIDVPGATVAPTASSNSPICAGNTLNLTGTGTGTYAWTGPNSFTSSAQNPTIPNATTLATGTYTISVTNTNGCVFNATTAVTVNALPTATASSSTPSICAGTTILLIGGGVGTYLWTGPNGYTSTAQSPTIASATVLASGIYRITVTNANSCTSTATTSVTVNLLPVVDAGGTQIICEGSTASLTATCNLLTFNTTLSGTSEVPANASTATGNVSGTYDKVSKQLLLTFTFNGLVANASAAHLHRGPVGGNGPVQIPFSGVPAATSGSFTYTGTLTASQETDLLAGIYYANIHNASFPGGEIRGQLSTACIANNFVWNPGNLSGQTVTVSPIATQLYTVTASNTTTGCSSTATTTVNVNPKPVPAIGSNTPVCAGNTLNLTSGGGTSYAWVGPNTFTSTAQNPNIASVTLLATGTYTVTVTNVNGCTNTATTAVVINSLPTATASNNTPICSGVTLNLIGGGGVSYAWSGPSGYTSTAQSPSIPLATTSMSGTYTITVTNANGCTSTATTSVTVNPVVNPPVPQANTQIIFGASITLTATGCSGVNDVLKWYKSSDNSLAGMPVSPTATTNYYAKCETTLNGITCTSGNSTDVTVTVLQPNPPVATGATNCLGTPTTLTATGCSGSVGTFVLKWYQNADDVLVTMPVSPLVSTDYYAKCEQTFNAVTAISAKSNVVTLTILNPPTPVSTGGTIYNGQSISLTATGCTGTPGTFTLKWYQTSDNAIVTMPVSPTVTTQYYSKCEQTANSVTCLSAKSNDVTVMVVNRIFVDITKVAAPVQNGNSWATAYGNLQTGLAAATAGVEVWVAKGTYKPTNTTTRTIYFNIPNNVIVYGGFAGTEDNLIDRNFRTNISILSGDIGTLNLETDNSYHVVVMNGSSASTVLDGFTITGGYANFDPKRVFNLPISLPTTSTIETGGGIVVQNAGSPMIANCIISQNAAVMGGGLYVGDASTPNILLCKIIGNQAGFGSALYFQDGSHGKVNNTLISGNKGIGAVYNNTSNPMITNVTFGGNGGYNGGIFNANSQPVIKNSIIWGNSTPFNDTQSIITYSTIQGGYAGTGNLSMNPKYISPMPDGLAPITTGDYHLQASSLAIDRGDNGTISLTDKDLDGNLRRFAGGRVDMGAYEFQGAATATLVISVVTGPWEANSTWDVGRVPQLGDYVIIDNSHIVTLTGTGIAKNLEYRGTGKLKFNATTSKLEIGF
jgi:CHRD domain/Bacterial Ig domain/Ig-like domain CHU_C associated/PKD-like domain